LFLQFKTSPINLNNTHHVKNIIVIIIEMARFIVEAWDMFFNFPVEVSVSTMAYIDTVVREAC
jgi:hypothetical protein